MSKARQKGTSFESAVVNFLRENGFPDAERWGSATMDQGDIRNVPMVLEAKNHKAMALAEWVDQSIEAGKRANKLPAVVHKRPRKGVEKSYVTMPLDVFVSLMRLQKDSNP